MDDTSQPTAAGRPGLPAVDAGRRPVVVVDVSTVRLRRQGRWVHVETAERVPLGAVTVAGAGDVDDVRAVVQRALDAAAAATVPHPVVGAGGKVQLVACQVAFYNPYSAQVGVGSGTQERLYGDGVPVALPSGGTLAWADGEVLEVDGRSVPAVADVAAAAVAALAQQAA